LNLLRKFILLLLAFTVPNGERIIAARVINIDHFSDDTASDPIAVLIHSQDCQEPVVASVATADSVHTAQRTNGASDNVGAKRPCNFS
jgi:hypothetical protein